MTNQVTYSVLFVKKAKDLKKKHPSLTQDLEELEKVLLNNPKHGVDLGGGLYKIRLAIKSKGKGKSGGYRVITYLIVQSIESIEINMVTLYDKSEESTIDKQYLLKLLKSLY